VDKFVRILICLVIFTYLFYRFLDNKVAHLHRITKNSLLFTLNVEYTIIQ